MIRVCIDCGRQFEITPGEERFYKSKGLDLPKRCKPCRDKKRSMNNASASNSHLNTEQYYLPRRYNHNANGYNNRDVIKAKKKSPLGIGVALALAVISIVLFAVGGTVGLFGIATLLTSVLVYIFSKTTEEIDLSFHRRYPHRFYDAKALYKHYIKHGREVNCHSPEEYLSKANKVVESRFAQTKTTVDGDTAYYIAQTGEFVVVSPRNYIRTYYKVTYGYFLKQ